MGLVGWGKGCVTIARPSTPRRGGRVVDCTRLEIGSTERYRGFKSHPLRS